MVNNIKLLMENKLSYIVCASDEVYNFEDYQIVWLCVNFPFLMVLPQKIIEK